MMTNLLGAISVAFTFARKGVNRLRFTTHFIFLSFLLSSIALCCGSSLAQQAPSSMPKAQEVPPSGRSKSGGGVQAQQSSNGNGGTSSVNTVNSTIQV